MLMVATGTMVAVHRRRILALVLVGGALLMTLMVLAAVKGNFSDLLQKAIDGSASGQKIIEPGLKYGKTETTKLDFISLALALVLGTAGLPHVLMRFYTVPTAKEARKSVTWAIVLIGSFYLLTLILGYAAAAFVGPDRILAAPGGANAAAPQEGGGWRMRRAGGYGPGRASAQRGGR